MSLDSILKRYFPVVLLALVGVAAYFQASGVTQLLGTALAVDEKGLLAGGPAPLKAGAASTASNHHLTTAAKIIERNPFDSKTGNLNPPPEVSAATTEPEAPPLPPTENPYGAPPCEGGHKILTTAVSSDAAWSFALLSDGTKSTMVRQGSDVGGKQVWFIRWDRVWLIGSSVFCQIEMFPHAAPESSKGTGTSGAASASSKAPPPPPPGNAPAVPEDIKKSIQKVSATEYNIDRSAIDKILENQQLIMRSARVVPETENGKTVGIRLFGVRPDSLLGMIGVENGDRLERVNGFDVASPEKALEAYARLRSAEKLTVQVNRRGQPTTLDFHIK
jgi:general secretion pathway protein C